MSREVDETYSFAVRYSFAGRLHAANVVVATKAVRGAAKQSSSLYLLRLDITSARFQFAKKITHYT